MRIIAATGIGKEVERPSQVSSSDLESVFARYVDPIYRFLYARVGNREDAEDLCSEVFLKASRQLDTGRQESSVASWLFTVARTVLADHWRRYYRAGTVVSLGDDDPALEAPVPEALGGASPSRRAVAILEALPDRYRTILELRFLKGYTIREAAEAMGVTPENAKVLQHRALARAVRIGETL